MMAALVKQMPIFDDETLTNYCARLASAHDLPNAQALAFYTGFDFFGLSNGGFSDVEKFAKLVGVEKSRFDRALIRSHDKALIAVRGELYSRRFFALRHNRLCAQCMLEDEQHRQAPKGSRSFIRMSWLPRFVHNCDIHHVALTTMTVASKRIVGDFYMRRHSGDQYLTGIARDASVGMPTRLEKYFLSRFRAGGGNGTWMDSIPLQAICHLAELVGLFERHGPAGDPNQISDSERMQCGAVGYAILQQGEDNFRSMVSNVAERFYELRSAPGPSALFGSLATDMMWYATVPGYQTLIDIMQDVAIRTLPIGPGDKFFGPVKRRVLHSVSTARREFGIGRNAMLTHLVSANLISPESDPDLPARIVFPAEELESAMANLDYTVSRLSAQKQLNATPKGLRALVAEGLISCNTLISVAGKTELRFFKQSELDGFLKRLKVFDIDDECRGQAITPFISLKHQQLAIKLLFQGKLPKARWVSPHLGLAGLYLNEAEWRAGRQDPSRIEMNQKQVQSFLRLTTNGLRALVAMGYLTHEPTKPDGTTRFYERGQVERFGREYATLAKMAEATKGRTRDLLHRIKSERIAPAIQVGTGVYRISDFQN